MSPKKDGMAVRDCNPTLSFWSCWCLAKFFFFLTPFIYHTKKNYKNRCFFLNYSLHITNTPLKLKHELNYTKITKKIYSHLKKITNKYKHTYIGKKKNTDKTRKPRNGLVFLFFFFSFSLVLFFGSHPN